MGLNLICGNSKKNGTLAINGRSFTEENTAKMMPSKWQIYFCPEVFF